MDFRDVESPYVVLDATEIQRDWFMSGLEIQLLRYLVRRTGVSAAVPASVFREVVANQAREFSRAWNQLNKSSAVFRRAAGRDKALTMPSKDNLNYEAYLAERLENCDIEILPWPNVSHEEVVARAAHRVPPVDLNGDGYRDTLTWLSCRKLAEDGHHVYLASRDTDFAGRDGNLSPVLANEVAELPGSVTLLRNLGSALLARIQSESSDLDMKEAAGYARDEEIASAFAPWDIFENEQLTKEELGLPPSAVIHDVSYAGSGRMWIERKSLEKEDDSTYKVVFEFPIDWKVKMTINTDEARAAGFIDQDGSPSGIEHLNVVVETVGEMGVIHDEHTSDSMYSWYYEYFSFKPVNPAYDYPEGVDGSQQGELFGSDGKSPA